MMLCSSTGFVLQYASVQFSYSMQQAPQCKRFCKLTCNCAPDLLSASPPTFFQPWSDGLTQSCVFKQMLLNCELIDLSRFVMGFRERHLEFWTLFPDGHTRGRNQKALTYHQWCALPARRGLVTHFPYR
jgi:hypothetical protein